MKVSMMIINFCFFVGFNIGFCKENYYIIVFEKEFFMLILEVFGCFFCDL